ncbi:MAG: RNA methyltransferase [Actinobacteria bacterium]|nr:RNA methyltransferase [Actinomycetota bacterium]
MARLHRRRGRLAAGHTILEGPKALEEAVGGGAAVEAVFGLPDDDGSRRAAGACGAEWVPVTAQVLARLSTTDTPQSPVAVIVIPDEGLPETGHLLAAWGVGDPGNAGTLLRTAAAFGMGFAAGPGTADPWSPKVLRAAAGGHWRAPVGRAAVPADLRGAGRALVATVVSGGEPLSALAGIGPAAVLVGDEAVGLESGVVAAADLAVTIPMPGGTESLNAAVAGAIVAYELAAGPR